MGKERRPRRGLQNKLVNRELKKHAVNTLNELHQEIGEKEMASAEVRDGSNKIVAQELQKAQKLIKKRNDELKSLKEELIKLKPEIEEKAKETGLNQLDKKITLTREELSSMGINLQSNISFGSYSKLSPELKDALDDEIASAILDKALKILNVLGGKDEEELSKEKSKDLSLSAAMLLDKHKIFARRTPTTKKEVDVKVEHTITDLISKSSSTKMGGLFGTNLQKEGEILDAEIVNPEITPDTQEKDDEEDW